MVEISETLSKPSGTRQQWGSTVVALSGSYLLAYALTLTMGIPWYLAPLNLFYVCLAASFLVIAAEPIRAGLNAVLNRLAAFLEQRGAFRSDAVIEAPKFAILRVLFGAFMLERCVWILVYFQPSDWVQPEIWVVAVAYLIAVLMVTLGLFTQAALVFLVLIQWQVGDARLGTMTLGNDIAAMLAFLLLFANAGAHFSLDKWFMRRGGRTGSVVSATYYRHGLPPDAVLQLAKFLTLLAYWLVCVYSLSMHLNEPAWMTGTAGPLTLTNNFMSRFPDAFAAFFALGEGAVMLGRIALWAMLPWYGLILPFVLLGGIFRAYIIVWAILFFLLSLFVLQLGWLAHFEFLLLAGWFWERRFMAGPKTLHVAYDDRCNLCDRTVSFVKRVDLFRRVELRPLSTNQEWLKAIGVDPRDAMVDLYGVELNGAVRVAKGYDFYLLLAHHVLLLLPAWPVLMAGKYLGGPAIYRYIAERRTRVFGVCKIPTPKAEYEFLPQAVTHKKLIAGYDPASPIALQFIVLALAYLITIPAPSLGWNGVPLPALLAPTADTAARAAHIYGMTPINVFNHSDLRMTENWFTIAGIDKSGKVTMLPVLAEDGGRLAMHRSDRVYFGYTLPYRRGVIGLEGCFFDKYRSTLMYLTESHRAAASFDRFSYRQYLQPLPSLEKLLAGVFSPNEVVKVCEVEF